MLFYNFRLELDLNIVVEEEEGGEAELAEPADFLRRAPLITLRARDLDRALIFVLGFLQREQNHSLGMAPFLTLAQEKWSQVRQEEHWIMGRPPYGFRQMQVISSSSSVSSRTTVKLESSTLQRFCLKDPADKDICEYLTEIWQFMFCEEHLSSPSPSPKSKIQSPCL